MRISDWSSDVCSSDLGEVRARAEGFAREQWNRGERIVEKAAEAAKVEAERQGLTPEGMAKKAGKVVDAGKQAGEQAGKSEPGGQDGIGRAHWRERVCQTVEVSVVTLTLKKKPKRKTSTD